MHLNAIQRHFFLTTSGSKFGPFIHTPVCVWGIGQTRWGYLSIEYEVLQILHIEDFIVVLEVKIWGRSFYVKERWGSGICKFLRSCESVDNAERKIWMIIHRIIFPKRIGLSGGHPAAGELQVPEAVKGAQVLRFSEPRDTSFPNLSSSFCNTSAVSFVLTLVSSPI